MCVCACLQYMLLYVLKSCVPKQFVERTTLQNRRGKVISLHYFRKTRCPRKRTGSKHCVYVLTFSRVSAVSISILNALYEIWKGILLIEESM